MSKAMPADSEGVRYVLPGNTVQQREIRIVNRLGLHAPLPKLTQTACRSSGAEVWISRNDRRVSKKHHGRDDAGCRQGPHSSPETDGPDGATNQWRLVPDQNTASVKANDRAAAKMPPQ